MGHILFFPKKKPCGHILIWSQGSRFNPDNYFLVKSMHPIKFYLKSYRQVF